MPQRAFIRHCNGRTIALFDRMLLSCLKGMGKASRSPGRRSDRHDPNKQKREREDHMRRLLTLVGLLVLVAAISVGTALAAVIFDPVTGEGFVGKGDVQLVFGWNNKG